MVVALSLRTDYHRDGRLIGFTLAELQLWIEQHVPPNSTAAIAMTDRQYSWYAHLCGKCEKRVNGHIIIFLDAPRPTI
jgi:hypothetical protein